MNLFVIAQSGRSALAVTFMFMTAWVFEAHHCPTLLNEIKKTILTITHHPKLA